MSFRLYESAWVDQQGMSEPQQVHKDPAQSGTFLVGGYRYDIDARLMPGQAGAPVLLSLLNLQNTRDAGLPSNYSGDIERP